MVEAREMQDQRLDALSSILSRQREIGEMIGTELDHHITLLDDTEQAVGATQSRIQQAGKRMQRILADDSKSGMVVCILLIVLAVVVILARLL